MSKNTIDDRFISFALALGIEGFVAEYKTVQIDSVGAKKMKEAKEALYQDLMALVGEDEPFKNLYQWEQAEPINLEKQRIRQNINRYFKRGEG